MGRSYPSELGRIPATIEWALAQDVSALRSALLQQLGGHNLVAIGSGGSFTAAAFAALLHEAATGRLARAATPLEAITRSPVRDTAVLLLSARGTNVDILRAAEMLLGLGYDAVSAVTTRKGSPLGRLLMGYGATAHEFTVPGGRDGFLATNSLMATLVLLHRAVLSISGSPDEDQRDLVTSRPSTKGSATVLGNRTLVVLAQGWAVPAALDLESRFSEAALASVTVTDPRNFAHGRHHWLSLHAADTGIVSLETQGSTREAARMLRFLPKDIDVLRVMSAREGPSATIELVRSVMEFAGQVAEARGIDPGRPFVADFGRRLFRAGATRSLRSREALPVAKKRRALFLGPQSNGDELTNALREFVQRLERAAFSGLAVDYDGTLCARDHRFDPLTQDIQDELNRLLGEGMLLGVASGRGKSLHTTLRAAVHRQYWNRVVVGLYNGAMVVELSEDVKEPEGDIPQSLAAALSRLRPLGALLGFEAVVRPHQISLRLEDGTDPYELQNVVKEQLAGIADISIMNSSHSVDIVPLGTSKTAVVDALNSKQPGCILRIGDQGATGGNDFELLNTGLSLSVDRVSSRLETCWNLGAPGIAGPPLTLRYLRALKKDGEMFHLDTSSLLDDLGG